MTQSEQKLQAQRLIQQSLPWAVIVVGSLAWAASWGFAAVADAQTRTGPQYISPRVQPRAVTVVPPPPGRELSAPGTRTAPPEGGPSPTQAPPPRRPIPDPVIQTDKPDVSGESSE